jgi:hypothetical protein
MVRVGISALCLSSDDRRRIGHPETCTFPSDDAGVR